MKPLTSGVWKNSFWNRLSGPNQIRSPPPIRTRFLPTWKCQFSLRHVGVADDLDVARIADAEAVLVRQADVLDRHRIESHQLRRHRVDRHLVGSTRASRS